MIKPISYNLFARIVAFVIAFVVQIFLAVSYCKKTMKYSKHVLLLLIIIH